MRVRLLVSFVAAAMLLLAGLAAVPASADAGAEGDFVARINSARSGRGLGALTVDGELTAIARRWSQKMANDQRLAHNPNLSREVTQNWEKLAENVGFGGDVATIHEAFMNSAPHRANILDGALTHVGVGVVVDGAGQIWVTEVFMRLRGGSGDSAPPPTTAAPPPPPPPPPPTTARPRPAPTTTPPPAAPAPPPRRPPPPVEAEPQPAAAPVEAPPVEAAPAPPPAPSPRLVLVLDRLAALDRGR